VAFFEDDAEAVRVGRDTLPPFVLPIGFADRKNKRHFPHPPPDGRCSATDFPQDPQHHCSAISQSGHILTDSQARSVRIPAWPIPVQQRR
jgi:hypothetical protein